MTIVSVQKLENADKDADSLNKFVNGAETESVKTRLNVEYPTLANAVRQVMETGGFEPFATEVDLLASIPTIEKKAAKALDTKKVWLWDGGKWNDTGLSEYDLSKNYFSENISGEYLNLYTKDFNIADHYVVFATKKVSKATGVSMAVLPIKKAGIFYIEPSVLGNGFDVCISEHYPSVGDTLLPVSVSLSDKLGARQITINSSDVGKYLVINTLIPSLNFNVVNTLIITQNPNSSKILKIKDARIVDTHAYSDDNSEIIGRNIAKTKITYDKFYIRSADNAISSNEAVSLDMFEVTPGKTYFIKASSFRAGSFNISATEKSIIGVGDVLTKIELQDTSDSLVKSFVAPVGKKFCVINTLVSTSLDIRNDYKVTEDAFHEKELLTKINGYEICDPVARSEKSSNLDSKIWIAIGDSITQKNFRANKNYHDFIKESVSGLSVINKGQGGTGFHDRYAEVDTYADTADYVTVFWGTNDWGLNNNLALGEFMSTDVNTISYRMHYFISRLCEKYPTSKIGIISAIPRLNNYGINAKPNSAGYTLKQHVDLLAQYAEHYSLPFLNLYKQSNLPVWIPEANAYYFTAPTLTEPDGLHPNDAGQEVIAGKIKFFLESI